LKSEAKEVRQKPAIEYTYPQLLTQKSATRPGSILDRPDGDADKKKYQHHKLHVTGAGEQTILAATTTSAAGALAPHGLAGCGQGRW
jgi:hypothetical protein